jgi:hypothetical protein
LAPRSVARFGPFAFGLALIAALTSGARSAFVFIPLLLILIVLFDPRARSRLVRVVGIAVLTFFGALSVIGTSAGPIYALVRDTAFIEFNDLIIRGFPEAFAATKLGLGSGSDTSATRYLSDTWQAAPIGVEGRWLESWWVKLLLELGVMGFVLGVVLFAGLIVIGWRRHRAVSVSNPLSSVSAAFLAILIWCLIYNVKGGVIDIDPLNVYFWMSAGILLKVPELSHSDP